MMRDGAWLQGCAREREPKCPHNSAGKRVQSFNNTQEEAGEIVFILLSSVHVNYMSTSVHLGVAELCVAVRQSDTISANIPHFVKRMCCICL